MRIFIALSVEMQCASLTRTHMRRKGGFAMIARLIEWFRFPKYPRLDERALRDTLEWIGRTEIREVHPNLMEVC